MKEYNYEEWKLIEFDMYLAGYYDVKEFNGMVVK